MNAPPLSRWSQLFGGVRARRTALRAAEFLGLAALACTAGLLLWDAASRPSADAVPSAVASILLGAAIASRPRLGLLHWMVRPFAWRELELGEGVANLLHELSRCAEPRQLAELVGERLEQLFRPDACAVYLREKDGFGCVFARHVVAPATLPATGALAQALGRESGPLAAQGLERGAALSGGVLKTMRAVIVVPVRRNGELDGLLALGSCRLHGGYTPTELVLLDAIATNLAAELERTREELELRRREWMNQMLRRYVPGAVADRMAEGRDLVAGEREVSVLFVDIHGYTSHVERLAPNRIFAIVNLYTKTVSEIVWRNGGNVVEFNGDGMMAVFGAPDELPGKERAAVEAARAIVEAIRGLPLIPDDGPLAVGVGIATGSAFVGNIQSVDRLIWSAIGNTTNLASRLQVLTHELRASIVIDAATRREAGEAATGFELHAGVPIRGRRSPAEVYALARAE